MRETKRLIAFDPLGVLYPGILCKGRKCFEKKIDQLWKKDSFRVLYQPGIDETDYEKMRKESEIVCSYARQMENIGVFFDEIDTFAKTDEKNSKLLGLINWGRVHNVSVTGTVRRPQAKIPRDWTTEITRYSIFNLQDTYDCNAVKEWTGVAREEMRALKPFEYIQWTTDKTEKIVMKSPY